MNHRNSSEFTARDVPSVTEAWRHAMKTAVRDVAQLCRLLELPLERVGQEQAAASFPVFVPRTFLSRMEIGNPRDPLLRQVLPVGDEVKAIDGFSKDPVLDMQHSLLPGAIQKYRGRALLVVTGVCPVHCRYCFRRHFPYQDTPRSAADWEPVLQRIQRDATIDEIVLSGGDPLTLVDAQLHDVVRRISEIGHVHRIRVHTRLPIMIPARVTDGMLAWLTATRLTPVVVVHANHPREIADDVAAALRQISAAGVLVLNQSVLLRGVNDDADVLVQLSQRLLEAQVVPYYLHQLDRVAGAAHFEVAVDRGKELMQQMHSRLPGYAVPRYVQDVPGRPSKTILA